MERPSIVSQSPAKSRRPGATLLAAALSLLLHAGGVLAFVVLPWEENGNRTVEVGGLQAIDVVMVSGSEMGGAAGSGTPESEGEAATEKVERTALPAPAPEPIEKVEPERVEEAEVKPAPEPEATPDPDPLPVLTAETPSRDPVPPPPAARPAEVEKRAVMAAPKAEPEQKPEPDTARAEASTKPHTPVERPALRRATRREGQLARLGAEDAAAESAGQGESGTAGAGRQGAAPRAGNPAPNYPRQARQRGWEGRAVLEVRVDAEGNPAEVRLVESSGYDLLDRTALETVKDWRFTPARRGDKREADTLKVPIRFALR